MSLTLILIILNHNPWSATALAFGGTEAQSFTSPQGLGEGGLPAAQRMRRAGAPLEPWHLHRGGTAQASGAGRPGHPWGHRAGLDGVIAFCNTNYGEILIIEVLEVPCAKL